MFRARTEGEEAESRYEYKVPLRVFEARDTERFSRLDFAIRVGPYGDAYGADPAGLTLARVRAHTHGIDMGALTPRLPGLLETPSGKLELAPEPITRDLARLRARLARSPDGLLLVSRRHLAAVEAGASAGPGRTGGPTGRPATSAA